MEVVVDAEERSGLNQYLAEITRKKMLEPEESGDEWVDHSDMEDD